MRVLILGGTGLISTGITTELLRRGDEVTHLVRGTQPALAGVRTIRGDRRDPAALARAFGRGHDAVIDMLCFNADEAGLAVEAFGGGDTRYVMCSTVDVYTKPAARLPVDESHERDPDPAFDYAWGKAAAERVLEEAGRRGDLPVTILRPAATYLDSAVPSIGSFDLAVERLLAGLPVILHGDGSGLWAACHRDDVARAFVAAAEVPAAAGRAYNVTGDELLTWNAYWTAVATALSVEPRFVHIPTDLLAACAPSAAAWCARNFQYDNVFDCSAARRDLGFRCTVTWADGIAAGLASRAARPGGTAERESYEAIIGAWTSMASRMRQDLAPLNL
jgi:nucleoside-diphosphate-sugar epimerase